MKFFWGMAWLLFSLILKAQPYDSINKIDWSVLDQLLDKKVVILGESGHAVGAFQNLHHRLFQYAVENKHFRELYLEQEILSGFHLSDLIKKCDEPSKIYNFLDDELFNYQEFRQTIDFICRWNRAHPQDQVSVKGIDVWDGAWNFRKYVYTVLNPVINNKKIAELLNVAKNNCFLWSLEKMSDYEKSADWIYYTKYRKVGAIKMRNCKGALMNLLDSLEDQGIVQIIEKEKMKRLKIVLKTAITSQEIRDIFDFNLSTAMNLRDFRMAENFFDQFAIESKAMIFVHNVHAFKKMSLVSSPSWNKITSMGENLEGRFGENLGVIGFGGFDIKSSRDGQYPLPISKKSLDLLLNNQMIQYTLIPSNELNHSYWVHFEFDVNGLWLEPIQQFDYYFFVSKSDGSLK